MSKVLVTGAEGFMGSHLVERLVRNGFSVRATVLYNFQNSWGWLEELPPAIAREVEIVSTDVRDPNAPRKITAGCEAVCHLAALIGIPFSYESPQSYIETNITGTLNLLEAARASGVKTFIQTSTSEVYGTAQFVPIDETHPLNAQSPYAATKVASDQLALSFHRSFGLPVTVLRPFNTYGPRQSARAVIPTIITQLASGIEEVNLGNLTPTRDFSFVEDTCDAFVSTIKKGGAPGQVMNVCSGFEISIRDTAKLIGEVMNKKIQFREDETRVRPKDSEVERLFGCNKNAQKLLGWEPKFGGLAGFRAGIEKTIPWFLNHLSSYKPSVYNV